MENVDIKYAADIAPVALLSAETNAVENESVQTFPIDCFPPMLRAFVENVSDVYGVPVELPAVSVIAAIASMFRKRIYSQDRHLNYPQIWVMFVARSGVGKTKPLRTAFEPVEAADSRSWEKYIREKEDYDAKVAATKKSSKKEERLTPPIRKHRLITDITPEALIQKIYENGGITVFRDELAGWFKDIGRYNKSGELQSYLSMFDNTPIQLARKTDGDTFIADPYLSIVGTIQPEVLKSVLKQEQMEYNGMAQRFLFVFPDNQKRTYMSDAELDKELSANYAQFIEYIDNIGCDNPVRIEYTPEAWDLIREFDREITNSTNASTNDYMSSMYSKMEVHLFRLMLILWYMERYEQGDIDNVYIDAPLIEKGIRLCRYFISCGEKVFDLIQKQEPQSNISNEHLLHLLSKRYAIKSQSKLADVLGVSQQAVSKALSKTKH